MALTTRAARFSCRLQVLLFGYRTPIACKKFAPIFLLQLNIKLFSSLLDTLPGFIPLLARHIFHLVKACYGLLDMTRIYERLLALLRESKGAFRQFLSFFIIQLRHTFLLLHSNHRAVLNLTYFSFRAGSPLAF